MNQMIEKFGRLVDKKLESKPAAAKRLLATGCRVKHIQVKYRPEKRISPGRQYLAQISVDEMLRSFQSPDNSAIVSIFTPCEILHAMGIPIQFPEGLACFASGAASEQGFIAYAENTGVPETLCSYHKTLLGMADSGVIPKPLFVVNTTLACDANILTFRHLAERFHIEHYLIDVPFQRDEKAVAYLTKQLRDLVPFVEQQTGRHLDEAKLREAVGRTRRTLANYKKFLQLRADRYLRDDLTSEMFGAFAMHVLLGTPEAETYSEMMLTDIQQAPARGEGIRLLWIHVIPFLEDEVRDFFNFRESCQIIACDMNFDGLTDFDDSDPYEFMARRLLMNACNGESGRRAENALTMAKQLHADGAIYFCHWGCKQTAGGAQLSKTILEEGGIPTLVLDGDGCDRSNMQVGQLMTRIQAFVEMLENNRK